MCEQAGVLTTSEGAVIPGLNLSEAAIAKNRLLYVDVVVLLLIIYSGVKWYHGGFSMPYFHKDLLRWCSDGTNFFKVMCSVGDGYEDKCLKSSV